MAIRFDNYIYEREHEKKPHGVGLWGFLTFINAHALKRENCPFNYYSVGKYTLIWASDVMSLTDAKNELKKWLLEHGYKNELVYIAD